MINRNVLVDRLFFFFRGVPVIEPVPHVHL